MPSVSTPFNRWHHRVAIFIACATLVVIVAGALVTSEDAGLSVPDWPTSYGHYFRLPPWVGGIVFEHSHRVVAFFTGVCTTVIAFWTLFVDRRRWMKALGFGALGTIIAQGILGGMTVRHFLPPAVSSAHATVAQTFFCIAVAIAVFTGRRWVEEIPPPVSDDGHPSLLTLGMLSIFILYVQLILGAMFRHHGMPWWPHVLNAVVVALVLTWTGVRAILQFPRIDAIRRPAVLLLFLLVIQLCLGFAAFLTRVVWGADAPQPEFSMVLATVAHVATGALLLATTAVLTLQVCMRRWRGSRKCQADERLPHSVGLRAGVTLFVSDRSFSMKPDTPHPGITMHQIKVGGGFMGLVFTLGTAAIFLIAIPALWAPVLGSLVFGIGFALVLRRIHR